MVDTSVMRKFNLVKCIWKGNENTFAVIKKGWFGYSLIDTSAEIEAVEEEFFVKFMMDNGQLCDVYYDKNIALNDLYDLMCRYSPVE